MLAGFNTNVRYKGNMYHVQTEDKGIRNPFIVTLVFNQGAVAYSTKTNYSDIINNPDFEGDLRERVKKQHKSVISGLVSGSLDREAGLSSEGGGKSGEIPSAQGSPAIRQATESGPDSPGPEQKNELFVSDQASAIKTTGNSGTLFSSSLDDIIIDNFLRKAGNQ